MLAEAQNRRFVCAVCLLVGLAATGSTGAKERMSRRLELGDGLPVARVSALAQDADGFVWIGTEGGLVRYDGLEMRPWASDVLRRVFKVTANTSGEVVAAGTLPGSAYWIVPQGYRSVDGPAGQPLTNIRDVEFASDGALWVINGDDLLRRERPDAWTTHAPPTFGEEHPTQLVSGSRGEMFVGTDGGIWRFGPEPGPVRVFDGRAAAFAPRPGGGLLVACSFDALLEVRGDDVRTVSKLDTRIVSMIVRGETAWVLDGVALLRFRTGEEPQRIADGQGIVRPIALMVGREGSLWVGTSRGVVIFPEPETIVWNSDDGLPVSLRYLTRTGPDLWVSGWQHLGRIAGDREPRTTATFDEQFYVNACSDGVGRLWTVGTDGSKQIQTVGERHAGGVTYHRFSPEPGGKLFTCARGIDGTVWITLTHELYRTPSGGGRPRHVGTLPRAGPFGSRMIETSSGMLWYATGGAVCGAPTSAFRAGTDSNWNCEDSGAREITSLVETPAGDLWLGTAESGVLRREGDGWSRVFEESSLPSSYVLGLQTSPIGGVWILGHRLLMRVEPDGNGWSVAESLDTWDGVPLSGGYDVLEEADGSVWIGGEDMLVEVPARARGVTRSPPPVRLVDLRVDGERVSLETRAELPYRRNRLELSFAALSYRDPGLIRYRIRLRPDDPWSESTRPFVRYVDLAPGSYRAEVVASLDGERWTADPARFDFRVLRPWYLQAWAILLFATVVAAALYAAYRLRLAHHLRLERQRSRIAMDLHDEMGAGLASIGILAGLASDREVVEAERTELATEIATTAEELGSGLGDILWSLRGRSASLAALASHLETRARRMFPAERPRLETDFPESLPAVPLGLATRRNLQRIAIEAMHNVARHAGASRVVLGLGPKGRRWRLWIEDDGCGLPATRPADHAGLGLTSMRRRAEEIGAEIAWSEGSHGGVRVEVVFTPE